MTPVNNKYLLLGFILFLLTSAQTASAQDSDSPAKTDSLREVSVESVTITAQRLKNNSLSFYSSQSGKVNILAGSDGDNNGLAGLDISAPGLYIADRHNQALGERVALRASGWQSAFGVRDIQIMFNGIPLTTLDGQAMLEVIDPYFISEASVVSGSGSAQYGNTQNGLLSLREKAPSYGALADVQSGSFESGIIRLGLKESNERRVTSARFSASSGNGYREYSDYTFFKMGVNDYFQINENLNLNSVIAYVDAPEVLSPGSVPLKSFNETPRAAHPPFISQKAGKTLRHGVIGFTLSGDQRETEYSITTHLQHRKISNPLTYAIIGLERTWGGALIDWTWHKERSTISLFGDAQLQYDQRLNFDNNGGLEGDIQLRQDEWIQQAGFGTMTQYDFDQLSALATLRFDLTNYRLNDEFFDDGDQSGDRLFHQLSYALGLRYQLSDQHQLFSNVTSGIDRPTTTELVNSPSGNQGFNSSLDPEKSITTELGYRFQQQITEVNLTGFMSQTNDLKTPYQTASGGDRTFFRNAGESSVIGIEGSAQFSPLTNWSILLKGIWMNSEVSGSGYEDGEIPGIPHQRLTLRQKLSFAGFEHTVNLNYESEKYVDLPNTTTADGFSTINWSMRYLLNIGNVQVIPYLALNNLTDESYSQSVTVNAFGGRYYEPAPGFNWNAGVSVQW